MTEQISMIELFSGIGAQERALRQFGLPYEVKQTCDCDKDAVLSYAAMRWNLEKEMETFDFPSQEQMITELQEKNLGYDFQKGKHTITSRTPIDKLKQYYIADKLSKNLGDISKVERLPYADFVTYSYPCTDLSVAGKGEGMVNKCDKCGCTWAINFENPKTNNICPDCGNIDIKSTRSGLLGQVQRLLTVSYEEGTLPKYLLLENVKNLVGKKFKPQFDAWINWLDLIGYNTYYKVLNGKHYGIPQNRERIFAISIRKDVDTKGYTFPEQIPLEMRLKDILEKNVDERYYLPDDRIEKILNSTFMQEKKRIQTTDVCDTLLARDWKDPKCVPVEELEPIRLGGLYDSEEGRHQAGAIWDKDAISPTLDTMQGGNRQPFIIDEIKVVGNYMPSNHDASRVVDIDGIAPTVKENHGTVTAIAEPQIIKAGQLDCSFDQSGRVYDPEGIAPTIMSNSHGKTSGGYTSPKVIVPEPNTCLIQPKDRNYKEKNQPREVHIESKSDGVSHALRTNGETMVIEPFVVASRGRNPDNPSDRTTGAPTEQRLEPNFSGCTNTLTSVQKDNYICEPQVLRAERTEYGKAIRKQYESGEVDEKIGNMREMKPRTDGVANTITTLLKDNYVAEPQVINVGNIYPSNGQNGNVYDIDGISPTINAGTGVKGNGIGSNNAPKVIVATSQTEKSLWTETQKKMITEDGNVKRYINSDVVDEFNVGDCADISFPNGYNKANRVFDGYSPAINGTTTQSSFIVKEPIVYDDYNSRISADQDAINTLTCNCGASAERNGVKIIEAELKIENIVFPVMVRKYDVDCKLLCECLRDHKDASNFSNNDIADVLNVPLTKVEHWFRRDDSFAIPDPDVWPKLKELLNITTNEFDESIMTFEIKDGVYDKSNRCYHVDGIAPTLTAASANEKIIEPVIIEDFYQSREPRVYTDAAPTIRSERTGLKTADGEIEYPCSTRGKQVASAIRASIYKQGSRNLEENVVNGLGYEGVVEKEEPKIRWRIRKLTDKECWRLMNFTDEDNDRASAFCSASALYKQAGNSICVCCLIALMSSLFIEDGYKAEVWTKYALHFND